jgi:hypothetical protein
MCRFPKVGKKVEVRGIPHLAKNERDTPNFLHAAPDMTACAAFIKESRMDFAGAYKLHRKSGIWGTPRFLEGRKTGGAARNSLVLLLQTKKQYETMRLLKENRKNE